MARHQADSKTASDLPPIGDPQNYQPRRLLGSEAGHFLVRGALEWWCRLGDSNT